MSNDTFDLKSANDQFWERVYGRPYPDYDPNVGTPKSQIIIASAPVFTVADVGCYLENRGWYATPDSIDLAEAHGFVVSDEDRAAIEAYRCDDSGDLDTVVSIADDALAYLQSITAEGIHWEWSDGDLFLWADEEDEDW